MAVNIQDEISLQFIYFMSNREQSDKLYFRSTKETPTSDPCARGRVLKSVDHVCDGVESDVTGPKSTKILE